MHASELEPNNFHDGIVQRLVVDIEAKQTQLVLKQWNWPSNATYTTSTLTFDNVAWQNFEGFSNFNILSDITSSDRFNVFAEYEKDYLAKMKNYFSVGTLESIKADATLKYYWLNAPYGIGGFIICKSLSITETQFSADAEN